MYNKKPTIFAIFAMVAQQSLADCDVWQESGNVYECQMWFDTIYGANPDILDEATGRIPDSPTVVTCWTDPDDEDNDAWYELQTAGSRPDTVLIRWPVGYDPYFDCESTSKKFDCECDA